MVLVMLEATCSGGGDQRRGGGVAWRGEGMVMAVLRSER